MPSDQRASTQTSREVTSLRTRIREIIFEADTHSGKAFDIALLVIIILSVVSVMLESVESIAEPYGHSLRMAEWVFTALFTIEYVLRLYCVQRPARYARSFFGLVDLLAILPTYIGLLVPGAHTFLVIRSLRLIRIFRILKLARFVGESALLVRALRASMPKITVFLLSVMTTVLVIGALMYLIEGKQSGFTSIPQSVYWAIVTMTTVGYGDVTPDTPLGKALASAIMIMGYGIIAVPTGIVTAELTSVGRLNGRACPGCGVQGHDVDAANCKMCGEKL